jgi:putative colanic acid biosynthesis acetyltransferase WcaF
MCNLASQPNARTCVDLSSFDSSHYDPGRSLAVRTAWFLLGLPLLRCSLLPSSGFRRGLLRLFGAEIGEGVVIKPGVRVKYPWNFRVGKHCWIGEDSWIDNLAPVILGDHVCISQSVYLCTGNHDWSEPSFDLITHPIRIENGAWIAARASIGPGVLVGQCAVVGFGAVVTLPVPSYEIYTGNPATFLRRRNTRTHEEILQADSLRGPERNTDVVFHADRAAKRED